MADPEYAEVTKLLGARVSEDGKKYIIGLSTTEQSEIGLALTTDADLRKLIILGMEGRAMFPLSKALEQKTVSLIDTAWFEIGGVRDPGSTDLALTLFRENGGHASFRLPRDTAQLLLEALQAGLGQQPNVTNQGPTN